MRFSNGQVYKATFNTLIFIHIVVVIARLWDPEQMHPWLYWMKLNFYHFSPITRFETPLQHFKIYTLLSKDRWELKTNLQIFLFNMIFQIKQIDFQKFFKNFRFDWEYKQFPLKTLQVVTQKSNQWLLWLINS